MDNSCSGISPSILNYRTQKDNPWAKSLGLALVFLTSWGIIYWAIAIGLPESVIRFIAFIFGLGYIGALYYMCVQVNRFDYSYYESECDAQQDYSYIAYIEDNPCLTSGKTCYFYKDAFASANIFYSFEAQTLRAFKYSFYGITFPIWGIFWVGFKIHNAYSKSKAQKIQTSIKQTTP